MTGSSINEKGSFNRRSHLIIKLSAVKARGQLHVGPSATQKLEGSTWSQPRLEEKTLLAANLNNLYVQYVLPQR